MCHFLIFYAAFIDRYTAIPRYTYQCIDTRFAVSICTLNHCVLQCIDASQYYPISTTVPPVPPKIRERMKGCVHRFCNIVS